ncbi:MAG: ribonuclease Z [Prevotella sp.]
MEPFRVHILGCGSALPTLRHNSSSQVVEIRGKYFMVDCGEGTQVQLRRSKLKFTKISAVFISHLHGDHCFGLIGMISTFGMLGRIAPLHIYAPAGFRRILDMQIEFFCHGLEYEVICHDVNTEHQAVIYEDRSLTVESIPLSHRVPCCGFLFKEKPLLPHIQRDMADFYNIPVSQFDNIKNGADWVDGEGNMIPNHRLTKPADPPRSYAYCSDTRYIHDLSERIKNVDVLYHESTYLSSDEDMARKYYHSTAPQAATVASDAGVGKLVLGHYSTRYGIESELLSEAKQIFPNTILSDEGIIVDV